MQSDSWAEIEAVFAEAADLEPGARAAFLDARCAGRPGMRREIDSLLASHDEIGGFMAGMTAGTSSLDPARLTNRAGDMIGRFRLRERIGEGGMGVVYRAERADGEFTDQVAVKLLAAPIHSTAALRRFRVERQILARLNHPDIVTLIDGGLTESGQAYLAMKYVDGVPIVAHCAERRLPLADRLRLFQRVCAAVQYAHEQGVVHRDLKPANILVTADGLPKILDFGVAKLLDPPGGETAETTVFGAMTPNYASPEQVRGLRVTTSCDVYALGMMLYELLTGTRAYDTGGKPLDEMVRLVVETEPVRPSQAVRPDEAGRPPYDFRTLRGDLDAIALHAIRKAPDERYPSAAALADDLERYLAGRPVKAREPSVAYIARRFAHRQKPALTVAAFALVLILGLLGVSMWQARGAGTRRDRFDPSAPVRLVVLPFENLTGDPADDWLASAFSDSLTSGLQEVDNIVPVSRDRVVELYREEGVKASAAIDSATLGRVAQRLAARHVVHGAYQRVGSDIKVTARLIAADTGAISAQESVTAPIDTLLRLEDDLAGRFVRQLQGRRVSSPRLETASLDAYRAFIEGRVLYAEGKFADALVPLTRATTLDEKYAEAWALLAKVQARRAAISSMASGDADALRHDALAAAERAAALQPSLYDAHAALALAFREMENFEGSRMAARKAIELNARIAEAYELLADSYFAGNAWGCRRDRDPHLAEENFRRAIDLDPRLAPAYGNLSYHYSWLGREADALRTADEGLVALPGNPLVTRARALALIRLKRLDEADDTLRNMLAGGAPTSAQDHLMFGMSALARDNVQLARREFDIAIARVPTSALYLAVARAFFDSGHPADATAALDRAIALEPTCAGFAADSHAFAAYRDDPRVRRHLATTR